MEKVGGGKNTPEFRMVEMYHTNPNKAIAERAAESRQPSSRDMIMRGGS